MNEELTLLREDIKKLIIRKYERVAGRHWGVDEDAAEDEDVKLALLEERDIYELLEAAISEQEEKLRKLQSGRKELDNLLKEELDEILREMTLETEEGAGWALPPPTNSRHGVTAMVSTSTVSIASTRRFTSCTLVRSGMP